MNPKIPRKRGAPPGNRNAFKHGFYSSRLHPLRTPQLGEGAMRASGSGERASSENRPHSSHEGRVQASTVDDEIDLIRVMLTRHLELRLAHPAATPDESMNDLRIVSFTISRLAGLLRLSSNTPAAVIDRLRLDDWLQDFLDQYPGADSLP